VAAAAAERLLDDDRLQELVPELALPDEVRVEYRERARDYLAALLRQNGRSGSGGIELTQDAVLSGEIGLRLVERDKRAREQRLWSCLQVAPGHDVQLTIDLSLQRVVEDVAELTYDQWLDSGKVDSIGRDKLEVAVALIDVWTGDVLALGGQPLRIDGQLRGQPPGLSWRSSGDLGSVAKPFMLLEQFAATRLLRPHKELAEFQQCLKFYKKVAGRTLQCMHAHGELGRDPVQAIAESCNTFFFQVAEGLEQDGVQRALRRVGLVPPEAGVDEFAAGTWQPRPPELTEGMAPAPRLRGTAPVQMRGIGYDEQASPLAVARAYAALCSGFLPALALTRGPAREGVPLDVLPAELETVRTGLRECVLHGSASPAKVPGLQRHGVLGKTGTAEVSKRGDNNAWFAGYLAQPSLGGVQLAFAAVVYHVPDKYYGGVVAGQFLCAILDRIAADPLLAHRYLDPEAPR